MVFFFPLSKLSSKKELTVFTPTVGDYFNWSISKLSRRVHSNLVALGNNGIGHKYSIKPTSTVYINEYMNVLSEMYVLVVWVCWSINEIHKNVNIKQY